MLTEYQIKNTKKLRATHFETTYFENVDGKFTARPLPLEMQFAPIYDIAVADVNHDGNLDLLTGGNLQQARARIGKMTKNAASAFLGDGKENSNFCTLLPLAFTCWTISVRFA